MNVNAAGPTIEDFEKLNFDPARFDHRAHLFVAWSYLQEHDLLNSIERYRSVLRRLTQAVGVPGKYHETITWFFLIIIANRLSGDGSTDWDTFINDNPDLLDKNPSLIRRFYSAQQLNSDEARQEFVLPDPSLQPRFQTN